MVYFRFYSNIVFFAIISVTIRAQQHVPNPWLELGYVTVAHEFWTKTTNSISTTFNNPRFFMSLPVNGDQVYDSGYQSCTRIKDIAKTSGNRYSFKVKLVQPNDTWCNYTWWTPQIVEPIRMAYMILEEGHHLVGSAEFDVGQGNYNHHCQYDYRRWSWKQRFYAGSVRPALLMHHQSFNDQRFISYRVSSNNVNANGVTFYLQLHNFDVKWRPRYGDCIDQQYLSHYDNNRWRQAYTTDTETLGFFGYTPNYAGTCIEGVAFETHLIQGVTSETRYLPYYWSYQAESFTGYDGGKRVRYPGVFGMVNSFSGGDDVTIRAFNQSITNNGRTFGLSVSLKEDQCDKMSTLHLNAESMGFFVVGQEPIYVAGEPDFNKEAWDQQLTIVPRQYCDFVIFNYTEAPTGQPSAQPSGQPSGQPSSEPSGQPTSAPSGYPTISPSGQPTGQPTSTPTGQPTLVPTGQPTGQPTSQPTGQPTSGPSLQPTGQPTLSPSVQPTGQPTSQPTGQPTLVPTGQPTSQPSGEPTSQPSLQPSIQPTSQPSSQPTQQPTIVPTGQPTSAPSGQSTSEPTGQPSAPPSGQPSLAPSAQPTIQPTSQPTSRPSSQPSVQPTATPSGQPTAEPSTQPSSHPSSHPTLQPTKEPTLSPTVLVRCPWVIPTQSRSLIGGKTADDFRSSFSGCRAGNDLAVIKDVTLSDCQEFCMGQAIVDSSYIDEVCTHVFNIFNYIHPATTQSECEAAAVRAAEATCNSIQFTPNHNGLKGRCVMKTTRLGKLLNCEHAHTLTYDFKCESVEPHVEVNY